MNPWSRRLFPALALLVLCLSACKSSGPADEDAALPEPDASPAAEASIEDAPLPGPDRPLRGPDRGAAADIPLVSPDGPLPSKDGPPVKKDSGAVDFTSPVGTLPPLVTTTVAAIQYSSGQAGLVKAACTSAPVPDICAIKEMVLQARQAGAAFVVTPEYGIDAGWIEPTPSIGDNPGIDPKWPNKFVLKTFSYQAKQLGITLIINLLTFTGTTSAPKIYNTEIAFGPGGDVVATHFKFNLFGGEVKSLTAGTDVTTSVFSTALGKMGLLICADIYGSTTLRNKLVNTLGARVVAMSSEWTTSNPIPTYFVPFAKKWGVYLIVSNNSSPQIAGWGGAIIAPSGAIIAQVNKPSPSVLTGTIPLP
jgi:predicted amidohydrolase